MTWLKSRDTDVYRAVQLMVDEFGGLPEFVGAWRETIQEAREAGDFHLALKSFQAVVEMLAVAEKEFRYTDIEHMSRKEVQDFLLMHFADRIADDPELVLAAARAGGWVVRRPERLRKQKGNEEVEKGGPKVFGEKKRSPAR